MTQFRFREPTWEIDPSVESMVVSIPVYGRRDGGRVPVQTVTPIVYQAAHGLAVTFGWPCTYYLDQVRGWPSGTDVCIYHNTDAAFSRYVRVDEVHRAASAALALRLAVSPAA